MIRIVKYQKIFTSILIDLVITLQIVVSISSLMMIVLTNYSYSLKRMILIDASPRITVLTDLVTHLQLVSSFSLMMIVLIKYCCSLKMMVLIDTSLMRIVLNVLLIQSQDDSSSPLMRVQSQDDSSSPFMRVLINLKMIVLILAPVP